MWLTQHWWQISEDTDRPVSFRTFFCPREREIGWVFGLIFPKPRRILGWGFHGLIGEGFQVVNDNLAESQKPPGLLSIGADEGVRIHILSGRACKTYVKLIWNIDFYVGGTYVMRMWSVCAAQVKTYVSRMWNICETYAKYMWHINVFWDWIALCLCFTYVYVCEFMCFFMSEEK